MLIRSCDAPVSFHYQCILTAFRLGTLHFLLFFHTFVSHLHSSPTHHPYPLGMRPGRDLSSWLYLQDDQMGSFKRWFGFTGNDSLPFLIGRLLRLC